MKKTNYVEWCMIGLFGSFVVLLAALLMGIPVYLLWNWLMPELFNLPELTFLQALGFTILVRCLFGSNSYNPSK